MRAASWLPPEDPWVIELQAEIRRHPLMIELHRHLERSQRLSDRALARNDLERAAQFQEYVAMTAHRIGLLEDATLNAYLGRCPAIDASEEMDFAT